MPGRLSSCFHCFRDPTGPVPVDEVYRAYAKSASRLKLARAYWYNWVSSDSGTQDAFEYAGLRRVAQDGSFEDKPALAAYRKVAFALTR